MSRNECVDRVLDELERYGLRGEVIDRTKHHEIARVTPVGRRFVITSKTPSDWRASLNIRGNVRRLLKADNLQPKQISELSFQKAMSLPKQTVPLEHILQKDVDALTDIIFDMQAQLTAIQEQNTKLEDKLNSITVVSHIRFAGTNKPEDADVILNVSRKLYNGLSQTDSNTFKPGTKSDMILNMMNTQYRGLAELTKESGLTRAHVSNILQKAKGRGLVESGLRGQWRRKA